MRWATRNAYAIDRILEYLRVNGPCSVCDMKSDGVDVPHGIMVRMHEMGVVRVYGKISPSDNRKVWEVV